MRINDNFFPIGATYAPLPKATEVDCSEWEADFKNFSELGLNTFRMFICWDRIEKEHGKCDFARVDYAFELARKFNLKVIVNIGGTFSNIQGIYPPRWLVYDEKCTLVKRNPTYNNNELCSNRLKLCYDDPKYMILAKEFIQSAVKRYKDEKGLIAWSGWNEPRISECYCDYSINAFREWLKSKYKNISTLENAWSSEFPVAFRSWNDVFPQPTANFEDGGYVPYMDWTCFLEYNRKSKFDHIKSWIREIDPATPVISHVVGGYSSDIFGSEDILGTSLYTIHGDGHTHNPYSPDEFVKKMSLPFINYGFRDNRKDPFGFWVVETEAGPVSWVHDCTPRSYSGRQMNARDILFVSYGARAILRWLYRSRISDAQAGEFNLVGWEGSLTERAIVFGDMAKKVTQYSEIFQTHIPKHRDIYIVGPHSHKDLAIAEGYKWRYHQSINGLLEALRHIGVHAHLCNERQIQEGVLNSAKLVFCPHIVYLSEETAEILKDFVSRGGVLVAETPFAIKDTSGFHYRNTPGHMMDVFGGQVWDLESLSSDESCGALPAYDFRAKIRIHGASVIDSFDNGDPAVIMNSYGKGTSFLYASQIFINYVLSSPYIQNNINNVSFTDKARMIHRELNKILDKAQVDKHWTLSCEERTKNFIHIVPRMLPDGRDLVFILNMDEHPHQFNVGFGHKNKLETLICSDKNTINFERDTYSINLDKWGWIILLG